SLALECQGREFRIIALNSRGRLLLDVVTEVLQREPAVQTFEARGCQTIGTIVSTTGRFPEEQRSRQPSIFSLLRSIRRLFESAEDPHLGLYGAFVYDLALQFEPLKLKLERPPSQKDLLLYIPDQLVIVDHRLEVAYRCHYDFEVNGMSTRGLPREA